MITIAVANVLESSEQAMQLIYDMSQKRGVKVLSISPKHKFIYKNNKKIMLKQYIENLRHTEEADVLLMKLNKEALENEIYEYLKFDIALLFEEIGERKKMCKLLKHLNSSFYIVPDSYRVKKEAYITYGWSNTAHISASSAQTTLEGETNLQCCIQNFMPSFCGELSIPREFCIHSASDNIEALLAGVATMLLYGIKLE